MNLSLLVERNRYVYGAFVVIAYCICKSYVAYAKINGCVCNISFLSFVFDKVVLYHLFSD